MSDDGQFLLHGRAIDTLLSVEPAEVARLGWSDPDRVRGVLERLANAWTAQPTTPLGALAQALAPDRRMLLDALLCLGIEQGLRLLEQTDILDLFGRWALVRFLLSDPAFLTTDELAEVLEEFADHLEANQAFLINRGVPKTSLGASWPGTMLDYLYPTKTIYREDSPPMVDRAEPPSPRDRALSHLPAAKRATRRHSYWWLQADPSTSGEDAVLQEPFEDAARTVRLGEQTAARVEAGRAAFLALEITVLRTLANALRTHDAANLLPECLRLITGALTADEVAFYFRMDQWGYGYDIVSGTGEGKGYLAVFPGGLSNLLIVIGHCEQELAIGMMDRTKNSLPPEVLKNASFRSYFSYIQALGELWQLELDQVLVHFVELMGQEDRFWTDYQERVNSAIENGFYSEFVFRAKVTQKLAENARFEPFVRSFIDLQREHLEATGCLAPFSLGAAETIGPLASTRTISTDGSVRTFVFEGREVHLRESKGLQYLSVLLLHPEQDIHVSELIRAVDHPGPTSVASFDEGTGSALDPETKKQFREEARRLEAELSEAQELGNEDEVERIRLELEWIEDERKGATGLRGRDRPMNSDIERARNKISKQINEARKQISRRHPELGLHLACVQPSAMRWRYDMPPDQPTWKSQPRV